MIALRAMLFRVCGDGFRVFFTAAALMALLCMGWWAFWLAVQAAGGTVDETAFAPPPHLWHAHEMVFGYGAAALGGFFLTAVPNWTGAPGAQRRFLILAAFLWLAGRAAIWFSASLPPFAVAIIDLAFAPVLAFRLGRMMARRPKPQNVVPLSLLGLFWAANLAMHLEWTGMVEDAAHAGLRAGLLALAALIVIIGGRVTPAFTRNAMRRAGREDRLPQDRPPLPPIAIGAAIALPALALWGAPAVITSGAAILAGGAALARLAFWRGGWAARDPLLWSMHAAYGLLGLGLVLWGASEAGHGSETAALHVIAIGGVGLMTLSVMTRATLGHTGRPLTAPRPVVGAFGCMICAAAARAAAPLWGLETWYALALIAAALWILAFALFLGALAAPLLGRSPTVQGQDAGAPSGA
ncbi:NnrS family protein [Rhodovulum sp. DZ06]|uniref:NnrS family protein n=1 Tax=Rhodovulum sp. DZ06 TaxID=3425126 RepID=UPI003D3402C7